jgi:hypothetical protein
MHAGAKRLPGGDPGMLQSAERKLQKPTAVLMFRQLENLSPGIPLTVEGKEIVLIE